MKVLFIGDVCGKAGREALKTVVPDLRKKERIDLVITNIENVAHGRGATIDTVNEVMSAGIDFMTAGNHIWRRPDFNELLSGDYPIIRALNYPDDLPGKGYGEIDLGALGKVLVIHLMGWAFMQERTVTEPFRAIRAFLNGIKQDDYSAIIVDFHAEATSEKLALGFFLDGQVSAVLGTHTHVPTADERIMKNGTAYINDVGMVGPYESVLWVKPEIIFQQNMYPYSPAYEIVDDGKKRFDAVLLEIDSPKSAKSIKRVNLIV